MTTCWRDVTHYSLPNDAYGPRRQPADGGQVFLASGLGVDRVGYATGNPLSAVRVTR